MIIARPSLTQVEVVVEGAATAILVKIYVQQLSS